MKSARNAPHLRAGFTVMEVVIAVVLLNLLVAGVVKLFIGQNSMVESLEGWAEDEPVLYVVPDVDPLARRLGVPAALAAERPPRGRGAPVDDSPYVLELLDLERLPETDAVMLTLRQVENPEYEEEEEE